jgi:hypothetical protein
LVIKTLDPDPDSLEMLDLDPDSMNPDPQHCFLVDRMIGDGKCGTKCSVLQVNYSLCPIPPKFEKFQAVNVRITSMSPLPHARYHIIF